MYVQRSIPTPLPSTTQPPTQACAVLAQNGREPNLGRHNVDGATQFSAVQNDRIDWRRSDYFMESARETVSQRAVA